MEQFPERLRRLRKRRGLSQQALAERCGLSKNMIGRYEHGKRIPNIYKAREIADVFGVTIDYLCGD